MANLPRQLPLTLFQGETFDADDLVVTNSNRTAYELINKWPQWNLPIALLTGPAGSGKSHFAAVWQQNSGAFATTTAEIAQAVDVAVTGKPILIDNLEQSSLNEASLFHLINAVRQANNINKKSTLLMTAQSSPSSWGLGLLDLASRLKSAMFVELEQPDDALLGAVMTKLFADRQINVDRQVIEFVLTRIERSLFTVREFVSAADVKALEQQSKITKTLALEVLNQHSLTV